MALDYKNWKYGDRLISADTDTVERAIVDGIVKPQSPSADDLRWALEWLAIYASDENVELAQAFANCIAFMDLTAKAKDKRSNLAKAKREYAKAHGIPVSKVRVKKNS